MKVKAKLKVRGLNAELIANVQDFSLDFSKAFFIRCKHLQSRILAWFAPGDQFHYPAHLNFYRTFQSSWSN